MQPEGRMCNFIHLPFPDDLAEGQMGVLGRALLANLQLMHCLSWSNFQLTAAAPVIFSDKHH